LVALVFDHILPPPDRDAAGHRYARAFAAAVGGWEPWLCVPSLDEIAGWLDDAGWRVVRSTEFPSLSFLDADQLATFDGIRDVAREAIALLIEEHKPIPAPLAERTYSGKFLVRTDPDTHERLAVEAARLGISLNKLANKKLLAHS